MNDKQEEIYHPHGYYLLELPVQQHIAMILSKNEADVFEYM